MRNTYLNGFKPEIQKMTNKEKENLEYNMG